MIDLLIEHIAVVIYFPFDSMQTDIYFPIQTHTRCVCLFSLPFDFRSLQPVAIANKNFYAYILQVNNPVKTTKK